MTWIIRVLGVLLLTTTLLPLLSSGKWYIRWWDFPRLQLASLIAIVLVLLIATAINNTWSRELSLWAIVMVAALLWQSSHVIKFTPLWPKEVVDSSPAANRGEPIKILMSNLKIDNPDPQQAVQRLLGENCDLMICIETDQAWIERLEPIRNQFDHHFEVPRDEGLGMAVYSRFEISDAETKHLVSERRPSIWCSLIREDKPPIQLVVVHPTPPGLLDSTGSERRDSRVRDAELTILAREIAHHDELNWIVAGDFNDVAWSHTTRLFKRVSGLKDPRVGRSFMGTYTAQYPIARCPIDHVFLSSGFAVKEIKRLRVPGSDHFAMTATVDLVLNLGVEPQLQGNDQQDADELIDEGIEDAQQRKVESENVDEKTPQPGTVLNHSPQQLRLEC